MTTIPGDLMPHWSELTGKTGCPGTGHPNAVMKVCRNCEASSECNRAYRNSQPFMNRENVFNVVAERSQEAAVEKAIDRIFAYAEKQIAKIPGATMSEDGCTTYHEER